MRVLYLPVVAAMAVPPLGRWLARRMQPRSAAWALVAACLLIAATTVWSATVLAATLLEDLGLGSEPGDAEPILDAEAVAGLVALVAAAAGVAWHLVARRRRRERVDAVLRDHSEALVVLADSRAYAFCLPGRPGRVVVTRGMLQALSAPQRRVLLAHERAHLHFRHHAFRDAVDVAAVVNPLLRPARPVMAYLCERWADEYASAAVGSRQLSARSLAAAALAGRAAPASLPGFHDFGVADRVKALLSPLPAGRPAAFVSFAVAVIASVLAADVGATADLVAFLGRCSG